MNFDGKQKCEACKGNGRPEWNRWMVCSVCDGIGRTWAPGGPLFDCTMTLADRAPGEIVKLGSGARVRVLWHISRDDPETTFVALFSDFDDVEDHHPRSVKSAIGVEIVELARNRGSREDRSKIDLADPMMKSRRDAP